MACLGLAWTWPKMAQAGEPSPSWVFLARAPSLDLDAPARVQAEAQLSARALARRARARAGDPVDARDLPLPADQLAAIEATGARIRVESRWLGAVSVEASPEALASIAALPFVQEVAPVRRRARDAPGPWAPTAWTQHEAELTRPRLGDPEELSHAQIVASGADYLHACGASGAGVVVGVQDSGFDLRHPALSGVEVLDSWDFVGDDGEVGPEEGDPASQHAHGTMVLSLLAGLEPGVYRGVAPGVSVILTKTEDVSVEMPFEEDLYVAGLEFIEASGADIFTASLGYVDWYESEDLDGMTPVTSAAAEIAVANGLIVLNAAGNGGGPGPSLVAPADAPSVLAIGSTDLRGALSGFSSWGPTGDGRIKPDLLAPGEDLTVVAWDAEEGYYTGSGTSFATPMAAGLAALALELEPGLDPASLRARWTQSADAWANPGSSPANGYGFGRIDPQAAAPEACSCADLDEDGELASACGGADCDDADPEIRPGAPERCNRRDDDCDGSVEADEVDADRDGWGLCEGDCDDADPTRHPGREERCDNGIDDDCDGDIDLDDDDCEGGAEGDVGTGGSEDGAGFDDGAGGCGCVSASAPGAAPRLGWLALLLGLAFRRRPRDRGAARNCP